MALPVFDTLELVPEAFRDEYEEKDGKWHPKPIDDGRDEIQKALDAERTRANAAEKLATKAANELKKLELKAKADKAGVSDEQIQQIRADVRKEVEDEITAKYKDYDDTKKENRTLKLDNQVKALFGGAKFQGARHNDLWKLHQDEFDLTTDGKPMVKDRPGISPEKYIADVLTKKYPEWVEGTKAAGGGAAGITTGGVPSGKGMSADQILANPAEGLAAARASGQTE